MTYVSEFKKTEEKSKESENYLTNTENETELPVEVSSTSFTERLDEEIEADLTELRAHLQAIISGALPGFYEFQQAGYNLLYPKKVDIDALQARVNTMQIPALIQPQHTLLEQAANAFLDRFRRFRKESDLHNNALEFIKFRLEVNKAGWDEPQNRDYHQALKHCNRLSGYLTGTLDLMSLVNEKVKCLTPWETTRQANYDELLNELLPVNADAHNNQYAAQTRGNLTGKQPDNIKFNAIVDSVTLDERLAREALSAEMERLSAKLLSGITLTIKYAEKPDDKGETSGIKREINFLCQVLQSVIPVVQYAGQQIQPETYQPLHQKEVCTTLETVKHELGKAWNAVGQKMQGAKASVQTLSDKGNKNKHRIAHIVSGSTASDKNGDTHNINKAVFQVGIRLLDKIQQTTSDMYKAIQTSRPLQQAVSHYSELDEILSGMPSNSILDAKLRAESGRWRQKAEESRKQLQQALGTITTLSDENMKQRYLSALREELNAVTKPLAINTIIRDFDTQVKATVEGLSDVQKALGQALLRLSEHGQAGGKELDKQTVSWLQQLKGIKDNLKTGITQATGQSINNFSRQGMLARWMAEWSEAEKQRYLATLSAEERAATEKHYNDVFFEVIQHYLPQLSKESDPQGEILLQRLRLEVGNAANGNTLYPVTMADILAGMKSREQAIRDWSERKLIRGAFLAVCLGGVKLLPNLAALPLRLPIKFAITGAKVAWGTHKGRHGIRGGEGDISDEGAEYAKQFYKTAAIKIVLSLPPGLATTLGIASILWDVYEGGLKGAGEKVAKHIIGEAPWRALDTGSKMVAEAYATTLIEAAITEEAIPSVSHSGVVKEYDDGINFKTLSQESWGKEEITIPLGPKFILIGGGERQTVVLKHIKEIQKHESGRALLEGLQGRDIYICPPHPDDYLREDDDGGIYFGSRVSDNFVYFDPYNIFYGVNRDVDIEQWRNLHPSIVLFHELLHVYEAGAQHDTIIPSDPARIDENDYRKEFYESRNLSVVERHLSEHEGLGNQYASVSKKTSLTPSTEIGDVLKEVADALAKFEDESKNRKKTIGDIQKIIFVDQYLYDRMQSEGANKNEFKKEWLRVRNVINLIDNEAVERYLDFRLVFESYDVYKGRLLKSDVSDSESERVDKLLNLFGKLKPDNSSSTLNEDMEEFERHYAIYIDKENEKERAEYRRDQVVNIAKIYYLLKQDGWNNGFDPLYLQMIKSFSSSDNKLPNDKAWSNDNIVNAIFTLEEIQRRHMESCDLIKSFRGRWASHGMKVEELFLNARIVAAQIYDNVDNITLTKDRARWLKRYEYIKNEPGNDPWKLLHIESIIYYLQGDDSEQALDFVRMSPSIFVISLLQGNCNREIKKILHINDDKFTSYLKFETREKLDNDDDRYYSQFNNYLDNNVAEKEAKSQLSRIVSDLKLSIGELYEKVENVKILSYVHSNRSGGVALAPGRVIIIKLKGSNSGAIVISNLFFNDHFRRISEEEYLQLSHIFNSPDHGYITHRTLTGPYYYRGTQAVHTQLFKMLAGLDEDQISEHLKKGDVWFGYPACFSNEYPNQEDVQHLKNKTLRDVIVGAKVIENRAAVSYLRSAMYSLTGWEKLAYRFIPFYEIGHRNETDREYEIDVGGFALDLITAIATVYPASKGIVSAVRGSSISSIIKSGLKGGALLKALSKEMAELGFRASKVFGTAVYELVDPFPINNHFSKKTIFDDAYSATKANRFPEDWIVNDPAISTVKPNNGVYKVKKIEPETMQAANFYIKKDGRFYPVKYDHDNNTWRLIPPENSGKSGYQSPVRRNNNDEWVLHTDVGLKGGGLKEFLDEIRYPVIRDMFVKNIVIGEHTFKKVKYNKNKFNEMMRIAQTYTPTSNSTRRIAKAQQDYRKGKQMSHAPQYEHYNSLVIDEKLDLFNNPDTSAFTRGVLAGKLNESIVDINSYKSAKSAEAWKASANKATDVVLAPQTIFLKGRAGECLPESVLMGRALQSGQDKKLAKKLMDIYSSPNVVDNSLYKSLVELHANGNSSKFSAAKISDVKVSTLGEVESRLFPNENSSVRIDIHEHTMLLSKVSQEGKVKYVFYDPNYGLAYFDKYNDMSDFFKKKLEEYKNPESSTNFYSLDYSRISDVKIKGRTIDEIINGEMPALHLMEPVLESRSNKALSQGENALIQETTTHLQTKLGEQYNTFTMRPKENCANAAVEVVKELRQSGYADVRIVELGIWPNGGIDTMPANHYVVMAKKGGIDIVVDLTAGQFDRYEFSGPIISTKGDWIYQWQQKLKDKPRLLVKMAPLSGGITTSPFSMNYVNPQLIVPDGALLQRPDWYKRGINPAQSI